MKISKIIEELTELKEILGDKDLEACMVNRTMANVNIIYQNDDNTVTISTSVEGEKLKAKMLENMKITKKTAL